MTKLCGFVNRAVSPTSSSQPVPLATPPVESLAWLDPAEFRRARGPECHSDLELLKRVFWGSFHPGNRWVGAGLCGYIMCVCGATSDSSVSSTCATLGRGRSACTPPTGLWAPPPMGDCLDLSP